MSVTGEPDLAPVGGRQMNIDHLDGGKFFERAARGEPGRESMKATGQGDVDAVSQKGDENVGFNSALVLVEERADCQVAFEIAEGFFDGDELDVVLPQLGGIVVGEIGAQQVTAFAPPRLSQLFAIEREDEAGVLLVELDVDQAPCGRRLGARRAEFHQELFARDLHGGNLPEPLP